MTIAGQGTARTSTSIITPMTTNGQDMTHQDVTETQHGPTTPNMNPQTMTDGTTDTRSMNLSIISFNCHGIKSSLGAVFGLLKDTHIMFLSETWLKPSEMHTISNEVRNLGYWSVFKSSVDPEIVLEGRLHGGVSLSVKKCLG